MYRVGVVKLSNKLVLPVKFEPLMYFDQTNELKQCTYYQLFRQHLDQCG